MEGSIRIIDSVYPTKMGEKAGVSELVIASYDAEKDIGTSVEEIGQVVDSTDSDTVIDASKLLENLAAVLNRSAALMESMNHGEVRDIASFTVEVPSENKDDAQVKRDRQELEKEIEANRDAAREVTEAAFQAIKAAEAVADKKSKEFAESLETLREHLTKVKDEVGKCRRFWLGIAVVSCVALSAVGYIWGPAIFTSIMKNITIKPSVGTLKPMSLSDLVEGLKKFPLFRHELPINQRLYLYFYHWSTSASVPMGIMNVGTVVLPRVFSFAIAVALTAAQANPLVLAAIPAVAAGVLIGYGIYKEIQDKRIREQITDLLTQSDRLQEDLAKYTKAWSTKYKEAEGNPEKCKQLLTEREKYEEDIQSKIERIQAEAKKFGDGLHTGIVASLKARFFPDKEEQLAAEEESSIRIR